jgi:SAM-dependent methyltransferase
VAKSGADAAHWARIAGEWIAWARTPGHDSFWAYRTAFGGFVGPGGGAAIEVGCGEGRVSRLLGELGWRVTATDPAPAMLEAARQADSAEAYALASAADLPFPDAAFDLAVAYNVLMDVEDVPAAVRGIRRVLRPDGTVVVSIVHPLADLILMSEDGHAADGPSYFERRHFEAREERDGLSMSFAGWAQPIEAHAMALEAAGFAITALREPVPDPAVAPRLDRWQRLPLFLWLKARPLGAGA